MIVDQVSQQLRRLVSESYHSAPVRQDDEVFQVEFPRREDLERLFKFGVSKVASRDCMLEFNECRKPEPKWSPLQKVWIRFSDVPHTLLNDFLIVWSLDTLLEKMDKVDMPFTRKRGIARLLVGVQLDPEFLLDFVPWLYDGLHYYLDVEVEETSQRVDDDANGDVDMMDDGDGGGDHGMRKLVIMRMRSQKASKLNLQNMLLCHMIRVKLPY